MFELSIDLQPESGKHLYEQIYEYIRNEIRKGKLLYDEKLPSTRSLADYLAISRSTVDLAYAQLVSEGYLEARPQKGYFVCQVDELYDLERVERPVAAAGRMGQSRTVQGRAIQGNTVQGSMDQDRTESERSSGVSAIAKGRYDFSPNAIDMTLFPFATWRKINRNTLDDDRINLFSLGEPRGDRSLRNAINRYLHASRGVNCEDDQIVVGAGNDYLLMLLQYILGEKRIVAMENPTYMRAYRIFCAQGYPVRPITLDRYGMNMTQVQQSDADIAYVMPSHQYPTGIVMPIGRRMELLKWAEENEDRYIIEDDYDSEFRYRGKPIPALQASDQKGKVIYIGTFSKSIAPAIRISFMVLPKQLLTRYESECSFLSSTVSRLDQSNLEMFIREGHFERHLNRMRKRYRAKHDLVMELLEDFQTDFTISGDDGGLHVLLQSKKHLSAEVLLEAARKEAVEVYGMKHSWIPMEGEEPPDTVILGFGGLDEDEIREGMKRLRRAWQ